MWNRLVLEDACSLISRGISPKYLEAGGVRVLNQKCIRNHTIDYSLARRHDISKKGVKQERFIQKGDVLINSTGHGTLGRVAQVRDEPDEPTTVDSHVTIVRPMTKFFYLDYFGFAAIFIEDEIKAAGQGTSGQTELSKTKLKEEFYVSFPEDLIEQQRIVAKLDAAFAEIDVAIEAAVTKETEVQKLKASLLSSSLGGNDVVWKTQKLSDVIEKGETINPTINPDAIFSYIDVSSVDRASFRIVKTQSLLGKDAPSRARRAVRTGDVLFATIRPTLQRVAVVPENLNGEVCSTGYIVLRPKANIICSKFIFYYMLSEKVNAEMEALQTGASYPAVNDTQVKNLHISYPSLAEQQRIVATLDAAYREIENANESIIKSKTNYLALKSAILAQELQSEVA